MSNSGSEANETAAFVARTSKNSADFLALEHAYHGRTVYTVALAGTENWRNFGPQMPHVAFVPNPYCYRCPLDSISIVRNRMRQAGKRVIETQTNGAPAAMIAETIQGVAGIITPPPEYYKVLQEALAPFGTLLIADEVQTGWGRLGDGMVRHGLELWRRSRHHHVGKRSRERLADRHHDHAPGARRFV